MIKQIYKRLFPLRSRNAFRSAFKKLIAPWYVGNRYRCNCCNRTFRKFLPKGHGSGYRLNAECPVCGSLERTRLLLFYLKNETNVFNKPQRVLHFAPEEGLSRHLKKIPGEYIDADIDENLAGHVVDITAIPFAEDTFDLIICSHVLAHVKDQPQALAELARVLKPTGQALIMTRIDPEAEHTFEDPNLQSEAERKLYFGETDAWRMHGKDFQHVLAQAGFKVDPIDYRLVLGPEMCNLYSLGDGTRETIFKASLF